LFQAIIEGILEKDIVAGNTAYWLGRDLTGLDENSQPEGVSFKTDTSHGKFSAEQSLKLIRDMDRLSGFIKAIGRWPRQEAIMDVGCGAFPILALAAAIHHPKAEIRAVEIDPDAAEAAEEIISQFGFESRVQVLNTDIADQQIDTNTTAAVTETFNSALQEEPGPKIVRLLHQAGVKLITPSSSELRLSVGEKRFYQQVDLRTDTDAAISFYDIDNAALEIEYPNISASYHDDYGLVLPYDTDVISGGLPFSLKMELRPVLAKAGSSGRLSYELGKYPFEPKVKQLAAA